MSQRDIVYDAQGRVTSITEFDANGTETCTYYDCGGEITDMTGTLDNSGPTADDSPGPSAETDAEPGA